MQFSSHNIHHTPNRPKKKKKKENFFNPGYTSLIIRPIIIVYTVYGIFYFIVTAETPRETTWLVWRVTAVARSTVVWRSRRAELNFHSAYYSVSLFPRFSLDVMSNEYFVVNLTAGSNSD